MPPKLNWQSLLGAALLLIAFLHLARSDYQSLLWAEQLSADGSVAPALDADSPTGYENGLRHLVGTRARGETYRWIAYTQELAVKGFFNAEYYESDTVPSGRPQLLPKLYAGWLIAIASALHIFGAASFPLAIEQAALWEPIVSHLLLFASFSLWIARRFGLPQAALAGWLFVLFPYLSAQFIPGSLSADTWAMFLAAFSLLLALPTKDHSANPTAPSAAVLASLSLWLNPAFGFPAVLVLACLAITRLLLHRERHSFIRWASIGAAICLLAWLIDQNPWSPAASELRYLHPLYAIAWLGLGFTLGGIQARLLKSSKPVAAGSQIALGGLLIASLLYVQFSEGYPAWLYSGASLLRPSSLDESRVFANALPWIASASSAESLFLLALPILALALTIFSLAKSKARQRLANVPTLVVLLAIAILSFLKIRWGIALCLLSIPVLWNHIVLLRPELQRYALLAFAPLLFAFFAWGKQLPPSLKRPSGDDPASNTDIEALVYRHAAHWMASHYPTRTVKALASPELSDSLIFHGAGKALMSTAWQSYPGQVAASRILSAPESSEAEALIESRELTHIVLPSWDKVIPMLVQQPKLEEKDTLYQRLQNWLLPLNLRPMPYHLPELPGFSDQKLAVFVVTPAQDEVLSLSRLAEYFVEMKRSEPAQLAAKALDESLSQDPNATIAQAFVHADAKNAHALQAEVAELADDVAAGIVPLDWDRRVLRAIVLALGKERNIAKRELAACIETMSEEGLYQLTPLQTYHLINLSRLYKIEFKDVDLAQLAINRASEYL